MATSSSAAAAVTPALLAEYEGLMRHLMVPNTDVVRAAGAELESRLKTGTSALVLLQLIINHPQEEIRQMAAILLRMKLIGLWNKMDQETRNLMKETLLPALVREPNKAVRNGIADVVGIIARITVPSNEWPGLLDFLFQCTNSQNPDHREVGMKLFDSLTDNIGDYLRPYTKTLYNIFAKGLTDPANAVRVASLKAVGSLVEWVTTEEEIEAFGKLLPSILFIIKHCIENELYDECTRAFELFSDLIESPLPVAVPHIPMLIRAMLEIGSNRQVDMSIRQSALTVVQWTAAHKPKGLTQNQLLIPCLQVAFAMCHETGDEGEEEGDDEDEEGMYLPAYQFGAQMIDHLALTLSAKKIFPPCIEFVKHFIQSPKPNERRAAINVLTVISEGCSDIMCENLEPLLGLVMRGFSDPDQRVKEASCLCIGQFAAHLLPEIAEYHEKVLPMLIASLHDPNRDILMKALYALESLAIALEDKMLLYLDPVMVRLLDLVCTADIEIREMVLPAITAVADVVDEAFLPYYPKTIEIVRAFMSQESTECLSLRCRATECAGILAVSVGKEVFQPVAEPLAHLAAEGTKLEYCELREYTHGFFAHLAACLGADFSKYLPIALTLASASCLSNDGLFIYDEPSNSIAGITEDSELAAAPSNIGAPEAFFDEKASATLAIGEFARHTGSNFMPYLPKALDVLVKMASFGFGDVRKNALDSLVAFVEATHKAFPPAQPVQMGVSATQQPPLPEQTQEVLKTAFKVIFHAMTQDEDKTVVAKACSAYGLIAKLVGPPGIESTFEKAANALESVVKGKATCFKVEQKEYEDEEVSEERELGFVDNLCDGLMDVASVYGPHWEPFFKRILPNLLEYLEQGPFFSEVVIGLLAETSKALKHAILPYFKQFLQIAVRALGSEHDQIKRNAAYMCGVLCQSAGASESAQYYQEILRHLVPLFNTEELALKDNVCAAVARLILVSPDSVPLEHVLPLMFKALPLKADFEENETVYNSIFLLFSTNNKILGVNGVIPMTVNIFSQALAQPTLQPAIQNNMVMLLKALAQKNTSFMQQIISHLPAPQQQTLAKFLQ